jgi:hypothetical protein
MRRKATVVLAIALVLGSSGLSCAFARSSGYAGGGTGSSFRGNHFRGAFGGVPGNGFGGCGNRTGGLRSGFGGHESRDVWGHWGAYYGPMVPAI